MLRGLEICYLVLGVGMMLYVYVMKSWFYISLDKRYASNDMVFTYRFYNHSSYFFTHSRRCHNCLCKFECEISDNVFKIKD
jgi:hypothetical protein